MATISSGKIIAEMLENNGRYEDDPAPALIYAYERDNGEFGFAVFYDASHDDMNIAPHVTSYFCLFKDGVVTEDGKIWLDAYRAKIVK